MKIKKKLYLESSKKILKKVNTVNDLFKVKLKYNFPAFLFYDSFLKKNRMPTFNFTDKHKLIDELSLQLYLLDQFSAHLKKK